MILQHQTEYKGIVLEDMSIKKQKRLIQRIKQCNVAKLAAVFAENVDRLAQLANIHVE